MATEIPIFQDSFVAGADLSAATNKFKFVKLDSTVNQVVLCAAVTDVPIGVLQNTPASGGMATVMMIGRSKVRADAAVAVGAQIGTSADGEGVTYVAGTDTTKYIVGQARTACSNAGEYFEAYINCLDPHRGA